MQEFMITLLVCSLTMSVLTLFYIALTPLLAKRYSAKGRYYAWLIIIIGLIIPFRPHFNTAIVKVDVPNEMIAPIIQIANAAPVVMPVPVENTTFTKVLPNVSWWQLATTVWIAGMIAFLTYHTWKHYRFVKMVRRWSQSMTDVETLALLQHIKSEMGISKPLNLYSNSCIGSPIMIGFVTPHILLPKKDLSRDELYFILKQELVHYKRKDLYYKCLVMIATAIHWFNPFVYLMVKAINEQCELSCDAEVIKSADTDTRLHYSETIISVAEYQSKLKAALSTNFYGDKKGISKRILSIMDVDKKKTGIVIIFFTIVVIIGMGFAFTANASTRIHNSDTPLIPPEHTKIVQQAEHEIMNPFSIYEQYGLIYNANENKMYYKDQVVRFFIDRYNNGQGILCMYGYDFEGTIDAYTVRNNIGLQGELIGIEANSQADFHLRTKEIEAEQKRFLNYDVMTFRFTKEEAPDSLQLWIRQCEDDVFDFYATQQNGRYYVYVRGETEFGFSTESDGDERKITISRINGVNEDGYALFSIPPYKRFTVIYNGAYKTFSQDNNEQAHF